MDIKITLYILCLQNKHSLLFKKLKLSQATKVKPQRQHKKIKGNKLSSNCGLHILNCPGMSSIGWKIEWNASETRADVASLSSKKWNLGWGCP